MSSYLIEIEVALVMLVPGIYMFRLHNWLLVGGKASSIFSVFTALLLAVGLINIFVIGVSKYSLGLLFIAASPFIHLNFFKFLFHCFVRKFGRPPEDVYMNWQTGLAWDRAFFLAIFLGSIYFSFSLIGYFHWGLNLSNGWGDRLYLLASSSVWNRLS